MRNEFTFHSRYCHQFYKFSDTPGAYSCPYKVGDAVHVAEYHWKRDILSCRYGVDSKSRIRTWSCVHFLDMPSMHSKYACAKVGEPMYAQQASPDSSRRGSIVTRLLKLLSLPPLAMQCVNLLIQPRNWPFNRYMWTYGVYWKTCNSAPFDVCLGHPPLVLFCGRNVHNAAQADVRMRRRTHGAVFSRRIHGSRCSILWRQVLLCPSRDSKFRVQCRIGLSISRFACDGAIAILVDNLVVSIY